MLGGLMSRCATPCACTNATALATRAADSAEPARGDETTIAVYRLDVGGPQGSVAGPKVAFHASVDVPGVNKRATP